MECSPNFVDADWTVVTWEADITACFFVFAEIASYVYVDIGIVFEFQTIIQ